METTALIPEVFYVWVDRGRGQCNAIPKHKDVMMSYVFIEYQIMLFDLIGFLSQEHNCGTIGADVEQWTSCGPTRPQSHIGRIIEARLRSQLVA